MWTEKYIETLDKICSVKTNKILKHYIDHSTESEVSIHLHFDRFALADLLTHPDSIQMTAVEKYLKLTKTISTSNMWLFNADRTIVKYNHVKDIIEEWFEYRYEMYNKRKTYLIQTLKRELNIIFFKVKFIQEFIASTIEIRNKTKQSIKDMLVDKDYPTLHTTVNESDTIPKSYDYLLKMSLYTLTKEEVELLTHKRDKKQLELDILTQTTIKELWIAELNDFITLYNKTMRSKKKSKKTSKSKKTLKSNKTLKSKKTKESSK